MDTPDILSSLTEVDERTCTQLRELFNWNPHVFELGKLHASQTTQTLNPDFYDKHLAKHLRLLKLCVSPSIPSRLIEYVDKALLAIKERGISFYAPGVESLSAALLDAETTVAVQDARNETDLVNSYKVTTAAFISKAASMITLHPDATSLWSGILSWDTNRLGSSQAVADGYLAVKPKLRGVSAIDALKNPTHPQLPAYLRNIFECVLDKDTIGLILDHIQAIALWTFKSLTEAPFAVMCAILRLDKHNVTSFPWVTCTTKKGSCKTRNRDRIKARTGPDSDELTRGLDASVLTLVSPHPSTRTPENPDARKASPSVFVGSGKIAEMKDEDGRVDSSDKGVPLIFPPKITQTRKRKRGRNSLNGEDTNEERRKDHELGDVYRQSDDGRAEHWVQQAWCEAVRADATVVTFHSGNYEIIGFRHRATQTFYISEIIEPPTQAQYGKVEVGLCIAAFQDAARRCKKSKKDIKDNDNTGSDSNAVDQRQKIICDDLGYRGSRRVKGETDKALQLTGSRNIAAIFLGYGIYDSVSPACFYRTHPSLYPGAALQNPLPSPDRPSYLADEYVTFALISEYNDCATGVVHGAALEVRTRQGKCLVRDAIVKMAFRADQQERLLNEYLIYRRMAAKNVQAIPIVLGLYKDAEGGPSALVMTHEGTSLDECAVCVTPAERAAFIQALKAIHAAGILHNDIRRRNLVVNETGEVAIIDFDRSTRKNSLIKQAQELAVLENVLAGL
ncbi:hypothetical protein DFH11DRAFT_1613547 [Phellopilus nigrolimitatus]|nr:hypothetical protein DFH11DRAFT_1613547 [Phellopilus nigrolimitatus]